MAQQGDYIGFSFGGVHSSELGIVRISDGSRFEESLLPNFQDKTATVSGKDGIYYFGSDNQHKEITLSFAFDHLTEEQLRRLKQVFSTKKPQQFISDEKPYKYYMVKVAQSAIIQHLCFDLDEGTRIYKGEGTLNLVAYYPYARSVHKFLNEFNEGNNSDFIIYPDTITAENQDKNYSGIYDLITESNKPFSNEQGLLYYNKSEWSASTGMMNEQGDLDIAQLDAINNIVRIPVYNAGDLEADFKLFIKSNSQTGNQINLPKIKAIRLMQNGLILNQLTFKQFPPLKLATNDYGLCIDTAAHLIKGIDQQNKPTTNLYNNKIQSGHFFKIPPQTPASQVADSHEQLTIEIDCDSTNTWTTGANLTDLTFIQYDYIYY